MDAIVCVVEVTYTRGANSLYHLEGPNEDKVLGYESLAFEDFIAFIFIPIKSI